MFTRFTYKKRQLFAMGFIALFFSFATFYLYQWKYPFTNDECYWRFNNQENKIRIIEIAPGGIAAEAGLQEGDELIAIDGYTIQEAMRSSYRLQHYLNSVPDKLYLVYQIRRLDSHTGTFKDLLLPVKVKQYFSYKLSILLLFGIVSWCLGLLVIASNTTAVGIHFYLLTLISLVFPGLLPGSFVGNVTAPYLIPILILDTIILSLAPPLLLEFFMKFPITFSFKHKNKLILSIFFLFIIIRTLLNLAWSTNFFVLSHPLLHTLSNYNKYIGNTWNILSGIVLLIGLIFFWYGISQLPEEKRKALRPALLTTFLVLIDILIYAIFKLHFQQKSMFIEKIDWLFFLPLLFVPLSFAYAILRHGFLDFQNAMLRWLSYFLLLGITMGAYLAGLVYCFTRWLPGISPPLTGVILGLAALPSGWIFHVVLTWLRRRFHKDLHTAREIIFGTLGSVSHQTLSQQALLEGLQESLQKALQPRMLLIADMTQGTLSPTEASQRPPYDNIRLWPRSPLEQPVWVVDLSQPITWPASLPLEKSLFTLIKQTDIQVIVFLYVNKEVKIAIFLGGKYADIGYTQADKTLLEEVALSASALLETILLHQSVVDQERVEQELNVARQIQLRMITSVPPTMPGFLATARLEAAHETGGDLLWITQRAPDRWVAAVGDVSGKGLPAALYMTQVVALLRFLTQDPSATLEKIISTLAQTMQALMVKRDYFTLVLLEWDKEGHYRLIRAGHPAPLLVSGPHSQQWREVGAPGRGLGMRQDKGTWQATEGHLMPGEWIALYSDGLTEAMNESGELYGLERLKSQLQTYWQKGTIEEASNALFNEVIQFDTQNRDDRALFILARQIPSPVTSTP